MTYMRKISILYFLIILSAMNICIAEEKKNREEAEKFEIIINQSIVGKLGFGHNAAGGYYFIEDTKNQQYNFGYVWDFNDEELKTINHLLDNEVFLNVKGNVKKWGDGTIEIIRDKDFLIKRHIEPEQKNTISFSEIRYNMNEGMTELQFKEYVKKLKGKRVKWSGWVEEVDEKFLGGYKVLVDMDSPNQPISVQDITFEVSKEQALRLKKNEKITFEGTISSILNIMSSLQISLEEVKIVQ
ncbi:conserved exported hypothetical protein [Desulfamplus magnetovallimortis]|uniref:Uncharacterized protein n=1 Tax=Desulfamplus magnetovallimortis TaxID=1246637 RepID=A0A1W1H8G1_9BACT|nr:hypothetical protein [Desulfamplus magnetovallimortis]SLM28767.1 conserved exported hypothetical protein [Desulfamplus magnetovallimortis]